MRFFTILLFVSSQGAYNLFSTKWTQLVRVMNKIKEKEIKEKRMNKKPPYLLSPKSKQPRTKSRKRRSIISEKKQKKANK